MLYPVIAVPGRVNGGLHEMLTVEELMKECDKSTTEDKGPKIWKYESQAIPNKLLHCILILNSSIATSKYIN